MWELFLSSSFISMDGGGGVWLLLIQTQVSLGLGAAALGAAGGELLHIYN